MDKLTQGQPGWRRSALAYLKENAADPWDLVVVGGGITGAAVYRQASAQGWKVLLLEQKDFAWGTSSRSSKMVHGGLRYLGTGQFSLARQSVRERQRLLFSAEGLVEPLPFMMAHYKGIFPGPYIFRTLIALYDWMAGQRYGRSIMRNLANYFVPGISEKGLRGATQFGDAYTDDARLVWRQISEGNDLGGWSLNYCQVSQSKRPEEASHHEIDVVDDLSGELFGIKAKVVVNATGAWADKLRPQEMRKEIIRPLRGSHLVLPFWRLPVSYAVSFLHPEDRRPVFVFPWEGRTIVGTTDLDHEEGLNREARISQTELDYLIAAIEFQFEHADVTPDDIISTWSGVRPVVTDAPESGSSAPVKPSDEKREHVIWDEDGLVSIAGGKLTTFEPIAYEVLGICGRYLGRSLMKSQAKLDTWLCPSLLVHIQGVSRRQTKRLVARYGLKVLIALQEANINDLKKVRDTDTLWFELVWICQTESVQHLDDLMLRRTRLGLQLWHGGSDLLEEIEPIIRANLGWSSEVWTVECKRYLEIIESFYSLPKPIDVGEGERL